jgi:hypothetical protein
VNCTPLLNGPPAFIILVLLMAIAAYLRQVSTTALDRRDLIKGGGVWNYPPGETHTDMRVKFLEDTRRTLNKVSVPLIGFTIVIVGRILLQSVLALRMATMPGWMCWGDAAIVLCILIVFVVLLCMHLAGRDDDEKILTATREWERRHPRAGS